MIFARYFHIRLLLAALTMFQFTFFLPTQVKAAELPIKGKVYFKSVDNNKQQTSFEQDEKIQILFSITNKEVIPEVQAYVPSMYMVVKVNGNKVGEISKATNVFQNDQYISTTVQATYGFKNGANDVVVELLRGDKPDVMLSSTSQNMAVVFSGVGTCKLTALWKVDGQDYKEMKPEDMKAGNTVIALAQYRGCKGNKGQIVLNAAGKEIKSPVKSIVDDSYEQILYTYTFGKDGSYLFNAVLLDNANKEIYKQASTTVKVVQGSSDDGTVSPCIQDDGTVSPPGTTIDDGTVPPPCDGEGDRSDSWEAIEAPIDIPSIGALIVRLIRYLLALVASVAVLSIVIGGFRMVMSAGNEQAVAAGKKALLWAVLGLVTSVMAFTIVSILQDILQKNSL